MLSSTEPVLRLPSADFWRGRRVLITGHTGFKGGWLSLWLHRLGATVSGFSLAPPTQPNLFEVARVEETLHHQIGDIRNLHEIIGAITSFGPETIFHLAAQPILRLSYDVPIETYQTNLMGTVHVLEASRRCEHVRSVIVVTTDKCYENHEQVWPYRETDMLGGYDPYSSSKACAELAVSAYARSFFSKSRTGVATVRAGNVIGGGDWAKDRLIVDLVESFAADVSPVIRNPAAIRPWQHVLEPLRGYLLAAEYVQKTAPEESAAWNFGPDATGEACVADVVNLFAAAWGSQRRMHVVPDPRHLHEAGTLRLDSSKARTELAWTPALSLQKSLELTAGWYKHFLSHGDMRCFSLEQIASYEAACSMPHFWGQSGDQQSHP